MEVDGSDPPFLLPGAGTAVLRNLHLHNIPWGGRSRLIIPGGKARNDTLTGKMGCRSTPEIHNNKERLEALRKQAVDRLRARRAYRCPYRFHIVSASTSNPVNRTHSKARVIISEPEIDLYSNPVHRKRNKPYLGREQYSAPL